jgi:hypothetical protein
MGAIVSEIESASFRPSKAPGPNPGTVPLSPRRPRPAQKRMRSRRHHGHVPALLQRHNQFQGPPARKRKNTAAAFEAARTTSATKASRSLPLNSSGGVSRPSPLSATTSKPDSSRNTRNWALTSSVWCSGVRSHSPRLVRGPTAQACDAPDGEDCVQSNRRPHQNADESHAHHRICENRAGSAVIQQHPSDQPAPGAARSIIARQPAGGAQREQRSAGDAPHDERGWRIERYAEQETGDERR